MEKLTVRVRGALLALLSDAGLFAFVSFVFASFGDIGLLKWYQEPLGLISQYVLTPWGVLLVVLRMQRAQDRRLFAADTTVLALLVAWIIVPFAARFGVTFNNIASWHGYAVAYLGLYAMLREENPARRARELDRVCALSAALSLVLGGVLLYAALTVQMLGTQYGGYGFGVDGGMLYAGKHYNTTGMILVVLALLCLTGAARRRHPLARAAHLIPFGMMALCTVLTQSRTARLSLLLGLAVCVYGALCTRLEGRAALRHGAGLACALTVLLLGYAGAGAMTRAAVAHYNGGDALVASAAAEETAQPAAQGDSVVRAGIDASFSDRTTIWKNLFALWRGNPKHLLIGNGVGRTGSRIVAGTIHEENGAVAVHNTYLQFIADFGLIGIALLAAFFAVIVRPVLRAFYARGAGRFAGTHALCALAVAALATGMMESAPLGAMTPMNTMLCLALAMLAGAGREVRV